MAATLVSLMAYMFTATLILYCVAILVCGRRLTALAKFVGFAIALPAAAIAALVLAPQSTLASADSMLWPGSAIGAAIGLVVMLAAGKRKNDESQNSPSR